MSCTREWQWFVWQDIVCDPVVVPLDVDERDEGEDQPAQWWAHLPTVEVMQAWGAQCQASLDSHGGLRRVVEGL